MRVKIQKLFSVSFFLVFLIYLICYNFCSVNAGKCEEGLRKTVSYFNNRNYKVVFNLFYTLPIGLATATTRSFVSGDTCVFRIEIDGFYHHLIESCFDIKTGMPLWHKWKISSIFGKKDICAYYDNSRGLIEYTRRETGKEIVRETLSFTGRVFDPLLGLVYYLSEKSKNGRLEEGIIDMQVLWYSGRIYDVSISIKKERDKFRVEVVSGQKSKGYAIFDRDGRPLGGEGYSIPVVGHVSVYDVEFKGKLS